MNSKISRMIWFWDKLRQMMQEISIDEEESLWGSSMVKDKVHFNNTVIYAIEEKDSVL